MPGIQIFEAGIAKIAYINIIPENRLPKQHPCSSHRVFVIYFLLIRSILGKKT